METLVRDQFSHVFGNRRGLGLSPLPPLPSRGEKRIAESLRMVSDLVEETGEGITLALGEATSKIEKGLRVDTALPTVHLSSEDGIAFSTHSVEELLETVESAGMWAHLLEIAANEDERPVKILNGERIQALDRAAVAEQLAWCLLNRWEWLKDLLPVQL